MCGMASLLQQRLKTLLKVALLAKASQNCTALAPQAVTQCWVFFALAYFLAINLNSVFGCGSLAPRF